MTILEFTTPVTMDAEDAKLRLIENKIFNLSHKFYISSLTSSSLPEEERENYLDSLTREMNDEFQHISGLYKADILQVSANYNKEGMFVMSYSGQYLIDIIGKIYEFNFNKRSYIHRDKLCYTREKVINSMIIAVSFLIAKYQKVYKFQIQATLLKVLVEFFKFETINPDEFYNICNQILNLDIDVIINKIRELNLTPREKIKKPRKQKAKTELPSKEQFKYWLDSGKYGRTQLEEIIAKQFHVSCRTVHRKLVEYGLVRKYEHKK